MNTEMIYFKASKVVDCTFVRMLTLPFAFNRGACNTFQAKKEKVLMCFNRYSANRCDM